MRAPDLYPLLRGFALGSFVLLGRELEEGAELPFAFEEHVERRGPSLYELRPLVRAFIEAREPSCGPRGRATGRRGARSGAGRGDLRACTRGSARERGRGAVQDRTARAADLDRRELRRLRLGRRRVRAAYAELEASLFGERRRYVAIAPLVGISIAKRVELAPGSHPAVRGRRAPTHWPESRGLLPPDSGASRNARSSSSCAASSRGPSAPEAPAEIADASVHSGSRRRQRSPPGRCSSRRWTDGRSAFRPVLPIAATQPPGEPSRLDAFRAPIAVDVLTALGEADGDPELAEALDRWELSLFQYDPFRGRAAARGAPRPSRRDLAAARRVLLGRTRGRGRSCYAELAALAGEATTRAPRRRAPRARRGAPLGRSVRPRPRARPRASRARSGGRSPRAPSDARFVTNAVTQRRRSRATVEYGGARAVLERLERIEGLPARSRARRALDELRALLRRRRTGRVWKEVMPEAGGRSCVGGPHWLA